MIAADTSVGRSAPRCPVRQASSLDIVTRVRTPARSFRPSVLFAARQVSHVTRTTPPISRASANTIPVAMITTLVSWYMNGNVPRRNWRASVTTPDGRRSVRERAGPYAEGSLLEWGSITKGVVGTTAAMTLELERPVRSYLPALADPDMTIADLVHHTSGLPRVPATIRDSLSRDPYRSAVGVPLDLASAIPVVPRGQYEYSNLGYALLGAVLDAVHGDWFDAAVEQVLGPAGIASATLAPAVIERIMPRRFGRAVRPWNLGASSFASAGGIWSTFDDLCRYADWALDADAPRSRTVSWQREGVSVWINGEARAAGAVIARAAGVTAVVHVLAKAPYAADRIAGVLIERERRRLPDR
ncbi:serine hydrolase domain-containing protein [Curtobacterium oceanosedimentum]|uniref:serine hydrolase domain-containing protein n=1 Tax=Curtobacterium oceanosedimentum TaxID=465820 RepID=UPI001F2296B8|nr:serine hydrolase domain-containing protein [Curtobacterium oceanosedimentum]